MEPIDNSLQKIHKFFNPTSGFKGFTKGIEKGYGLGLKGGIPWFIGFAAYGAITAPRGQKLSSVAGNAGIGFGLTGIVTGAVAGALGLAFPELAILAAGLTIGATIDEGIGKAAQAFVDFGSNMRKLRMGGDYRDTQTALTMRQAAAREMSGSLLNARQWLGYEASFLQQ